MTIRLLTGDCTQVLQTLPTGSVHCVVTSPPYFGLRDYQVDGQIGLEETPAAYVDRIVGVFRQLRRVLRPDGTVWLNLGDCYAGSGRGGYPGGKSGLEGSIQGQDQSRLARGSQRQAAMHETARSAGATGRAWVPPPDGLREKQLIGIPWRVAFALQDDGWWLRSEIIWHKPNAMPESVQDRPTAGHEKLFLITPRPDYFYDGFAIREDAVVPDWEDGARVFGGRNKAGANPKHRRTTVRLAGAGRGVPPRHAQYPESCDQSGLDLVDRGHGRNARNVWTIATRPYRAAHFATFPIDLPDRCIRAGTSQKGACSLCGTPWARQLVRERLRDGEPISGAWADPADPRTTGATGTGHREVTIVRSVGWQPGCDCTGAEIVPCVVLDPFAGAGTSGLAASRLLRDAVLIELNPDYVRLARERIVEDARLLDVIVATPAVTLNRQAAE